MPQQCKCPKCKRPGMMKLEKDNSHLPYIHCYACGSIFYRHIIERDIKILKKETFQNTIPSQPLIKRVRKVIAGIYEFHIDMLTSTLQVDKRTLQNTLSGMVRKGELVRGKKNQYFVPANKHYQPLIQQNMF